jgi:hypothetical protein
MEIMSCDERKAIVFIRKIVSFVTWVVNKDFKDKVVPLNNIIKLRIKKLMDKSKIDISKDNLDKLVKVIKNNFVLKYENYTDNAPDSLEYGEFSKNSNLSNLLQKYVSVDIDYNMIKDIDNRNLAQEYAVKQIAEKFIKENTNYSKNGLRKWLKSGDLDKVWNYIRANREDIEKEFNIVIKKTDKKEAAKVRLSIEKDLVNKFSSIVHPKIKGSRSIIQVDNGKKIYLLVATADNGWNRITEDNLNQLNDDDLVYYHSNYHSASYIFHKKEIVDVMNRDEIKHTKVNGKAGKRGKPVIGMNVQIRNKKVKNNNLFTLQDIVYKEDDMKPFLNRNIDFSNINYLDFPEPENKPAMQEVV